MKEIYSNQRRIEQINGREGETATLLSRRSLNFTLSLAVSPHVISAVRCFFVLTKQRKISAEIFIACFWICCN